jgi:hypothetical protein
MMMHLVRRFVRSIGGRQVTEQQLLWVSEVLNQSELALWKQMSNPDQRHSVYVGERFVALLPNATQQEIAGVLLHDIGKIESQLNTFERVIATLVGPRSSRFRSYHDHERIGVELLTQAGSWETTIGVLNGYASMEVIQAFRESDHI